MTPLSSSDSSPSNAGDPFVFEPLVPSLPPLQYPPTPQLTDSNTIPEREESYLRPYIHIFRLDPFSTHDGVHGRPVPAAARVCLRPQDARPITLEFQLELPGLGVPNEPEQAAPATQISHAEGDLRLRYLDGELPACPETGSEGRLSRHPSDHESGRGQFETTWSPAPLFHPLPQHSRQNFQLDNHHPSSNGHPFHSQHDNQDHPFTRINHTPEPESFRNERPQDQESCRASYSTSLAYPENHTGSGSGPGSVYASESPVNTTNQASAGYQHQYSYGYSNAGSGSDGYSNTGAQTDSHDYQTSYQNDSYTDHAYPNHSLSYTHHTAATPSLTRSQYTGSGSPPHNALFTGAIESSTQIAISHQDYDGHSSQEGGFYNTGSAGAYHFKSNNGYGLGRVGSPLSMNADCKFSPRSAGEGRFPSPSLSPGLVGHTDAHRNREVDVPFSRGFEQSATRDVYDSTVRRHGSMTRIYEDRRLSIASAQSHPFDSPVASPRPLSPSRELSISPTLSVGSSASLESAAWPHQRAARQGTTRPRRPAHGFAPFVPGGMSQLVSKSKEHWCTVCNKPFKRPSTLATHMNIHTGEKPYFCPVRSCGRRFSVSSNLTRHLKTHKLPGTTPRGPRSNPPKRRARPAESERRPRALQERKNTEQWCPESLRGMRNAKLLSSRPPYVMPEGAASLPTPLPPVRPFGQVGDENYEERDSFYYAQDSDELHPYHPTKWHLRPTLPGPLPSAADREIYNRERARASYGYGNGLSGLGGFFGVGDRV